MDAVSFTRAQSAYKARRGVSSIVSVGDSYAEGRGSDDDQHGYTAILAAMMGVGMRQHAIGGAVAAWHMLGLRGAGDGGHAHICHAISRVNSRGPYIPERGLAEVSLGFNALWNNGHSAAVARDKSALRLIVSRLRAAANIPIIDSAFSASSNLSQSLSAYFGDGNAWALSTASPASITFTVPSDMPAGYVPALYGQIAQSASGSITFTRNGSAVSAATVSLDSCANTVAAYNGWCARFPGAAAGDVIVVTATYTAGPVSVNGAHIEAPLWPVVHLGNCPYVPIVPTDYGWANTTAMHTDIDSYNAMLAALASEFDSNVRVLDRKTAMGSTPNGTAGSLYITDNLHPTPEGHAGMAAAAFADWKLVAPSVTDVAFSRASRFPPPSTDGPLQIKTVTPGLAGSNFNWPYTMRLSDSHVSCFSTGARALTLPDAMVAGAGARYVIEDALGNAAAGNITISPANTTGTQLSGGQTIAGQNSYVINQNYGSVTLMSTGTTWAVVAQTRLAKEWELISGAVSNALMAAGTVAGTYVLLSTGVAQGYTGGNGGYAPFYLDASDYPSGPGGTSAQIRITGYVITNAVAQTATFTFQLCPVSTWAGASGANPTIGSIGSAVVSAAVVAPAASGPTVVESSTANVPASGWYVPILVTSAAVATNGPVQVGFRLHAQRAV